MATFCFWCSWVHGSLYNTCIGAIKAPSRAEQNFVHGRTMMLGFNREHEVLQVFHKGDLMQALYQYLPD